MKTYKYTEDSSIVKKLQKVEALMNRLHLSFTIVNNHLFVREQENGEEIACGQVIDCDGHEFCSGFPTGIEYYVRLAGKSLEPFNQPVGKVEAE